MGMAETANPVTWRLTGKGTGGACEHDGCGRALVTHYVVTSSDGRTATLGRGHLKTVTGWTLTATQADRELRTAERTARHAAAWAAWSAGHPAEAAMLDADCDAYTAMYPPSRGFAGGAAHEVRVAIKDGEPNADAMLAFYTEHRHTYPWTRTAA